MTDNIQVENKPLKEVFYNNLLYHEFNGCHLFVHSSLLLRRSDEIVRIEDSLWRHFLRFGCKRMALRLVVHSLLEREETRTPRIRRV